MNKSEKKQKETLNNKVNEIKKVNDINVCKSIESNTIFLDKRSKATSTKNIKNLITQTYKIVS